MMKRRSVVVAEMKCTHLTLSMLLFIATPAWAYIFGEIGSVDEYLRFGKTIIIVECLPSDKDTVCKGWFCRKTHVIDVMEGDVKKDQIIRVVVSRPLIPGRLYMIYSGQTLDTTGELNALSYEPRVVEITLWGEITKEEKDQRIAKFLKEQEVLTLREKVCRILEQRRKDMKGEQQDLDTEKGRLDRVLAN